MSNCDDRAAGTHHEVHLAVPFAPVEQLAGTARGRVGEMRAHGRLDEAPAKLAVDPRFVG